MPDLNWNVELWEKQESWEWVKGGEKWSEGWGGSEAQWYGTIYPRLHRYFPAGRILEIAPGFGRWTRFLLHECLEYTGVDLSEKCVAACRKRFDARHARFLRNDGLSLRDAGASYDFVFSFDSLVHSDREVFERYIPQILDLLSPNGAAFLHHSNWADSGAIRDGSDRSKNVTASLVAQIVNNSGGHVLIQEIISWVGEEGSSPIDCMTIFGRGAGTRDPIRLENLGFRYEAAAIRSFQSHYSVLGVEPRKLS